MGVGSICRRQATREAAALLSELAGAGLRLHGFGLKLGAFRGGAHRHLSSADSLAWSYAARKRSGPCPESKAVCCNNCLHYALDFRKDALALIDAQPAQGELPGLMPVPQLVVAPPRLRLVHPAPPVAAMK